MKAPFRRIPIQAALLIPLAAVFLLLVGMDFTLFRTLSESRMQEALNERCVELSRQVKVRTRQRFETIRLLLQSSIEVFRARPELMDDPEFCRKVFLRQILQTPSVHMIYFGKTDGAFLGVSRQSDSEFVWVRAEPGKNPVREYHPLDKDTAVPGPLTRKDPYDVRLRKWFRKGTDALDKPVWSDIYFYSSKPGFGLSAVQAIPSPAGEPAGVIAVDDSLETLGDFLRYIRPTPHSQMFILENGGEGDFKLVATSAGLPLIRHSSNGDPVRVGVAECADPVLREVMSKIALPRRRAGTGAGPVVHHVSLEDGDRLVLTMPYDEVGGPRPWQLVSIIPESDLVGDVRSAERHLFGVQLALLAVLALSAWLVASRLASMLRDLRDAALRRAEAGPEARQAFVTGGSVAELADLAGAFNRMEARIDESFDLLERRVQERTVELSKANEALRKSAKDLGVSRFILDKASTFVYLLDEEGAFLYVNERAAATLGYSREEMLSMRVWDVAPDFAPEIWQARWERLSRMPAGEFLVMRANHRCRDASLFPVEVAAHTLEVDGALRLVAFVTDITAREEAELRLRLALTHADQALELTRSGYWRAPLDGSGLYIGSDRTCAILGVTPVPGWRYPIRDWHSRIVSEDPAACAEVEERFRLAGTGELPVFDVTYPYKRPDDGRVVWLHDLGVVFRDPQGGVPEMFGVCQDVTDIVEAKRELEAARNAAEAANRLKSEFLANMSHEIRTPMNAILGYAQLMGRDASLSPLHRTQVRTINRAGEHLLAIINDILEMSKIEAGRILLHRSSFDLHALLDGLVELYGERVKTKGLSFALERSDEVPACILSDEGKLRQALLNLVGNAVKFTRRGGVRLKVDAVRPAPGRVNLTFSVIDTGPGIEPGELAKLFRPFVQSEAGRNAGGTGLGLAISRQYARMLGGDIAVDSEPGRGSVFTLSVGAEISSEAEIAPGRGLARVSHLAPGQRAPRVLVAEDNSVDRELLADALGPIGFDLRFARNGLEAVEICAEWRPAVVLMDMRMPVMDGYEACRIIKETPAGRSTFILGLTASAFEEDRLAVLAAGADDFMRKPFNADELLELLGSRLNLRFLYSVMSESGEGSETAAAAASEPCVKGLPPALAEAFPAACRAADYERLLELCENVAETDPELAEALRRRVQSFDYDGLCLIFGQKA